MSNVEEKDTKGGDAGGAKATDDPPADFTEEEKAMWYKLTDSQRAAWEKMTDEQKTAAKAYLAGKAEDRYYENTYPEYSGQKLLEDDGKLEAGLSQKVVSVLDKLIERFATELTKSPMGIDNEKLEKQKKGLPQDMDADTFILPYMNSLYYGYLGIAYTYLHLYTKLDKEKDTRYLLMAKKYIDQTYKSEDKIKAATDMFSFVLGVSGLYALAAVIEAKLGNQTESKSNIKKLCDFGERICNGSQKEVPSEYIYGRCGYLYGLLFVNEKLGDGAIAKEFIKKMYTNLIDLGREMSTEEKSKCALLYRWYPKGSEEDLPPCLDLAHGIAGILFMLMQVKDPDIKPLLDDFVKPTVDALMETNCKFPSGNYRVFLEHIETDRDMLIHWCHGSPGMIYLFTLAYKFFGDEKYLTEAVGCSDITWRRGLLKKGFTICHGIPGNAYCFLPLWHASGDNTYLYRACKFLEYTCDLEKHGCIGEEADDSPMSLCCGLGGTICFLVDMLEPGTAKFPAFEVQNKLNTKPLTTKF